MGADQSQEKTEQPTGKKLEDARSKGNVAQSKEIPSVLILGGSMGVLFFGGSWMFEQLINTMRGVYQRAGTLAMVPETIHTLLWEMFFGSLNNFKNFFRFAKCQNKQFGLFCSGSMK